MTRNNTFLVYGRSSCDYCTRAVDLLEFAGLENYFFDLENDREFLEEAKSTYKHKTVPIVLTIDGETGLTRLIGGYTELKEFLND